MPSPPLDVVRDPARLDALHRVALLDTPVEEAFDRLTRLAARLLNAPIALVSLVEVDRQFFKSQVGLPEPWASRRETPLSHSFCQHQLASGEPLIIRDARDHPLVKDNRAIPDLGVVAYVGIPLTTSHGYTLGDLCVIDTQPRQWTDEEIAVLRDLATSVMTEIELRVSRLEAERRAQAVEEAEQRYRRLVEGAPDAILVHVHGRIVYANPAAASLIGVDAPAQLIGSSMLDFIHPEDRSVVLERIQQVTKAGHDVPPLEERLVRPDGRVVPIEAVGIATWYDGQAAVQSVVRDISARREAEAALRFQAQLLDVVGQAVIATDPRGRILYWNRAAEHLYGWQAAEVMGRNILEVTPSEVTRVQAADIMARLAAGESWSGEFLVQRRDGTSFPAFITDTPVYDEEGHLAAVIGLSMDITERKAIEAERERLLAAEQQARQDAEAAIRLRDQFLSIAAHELKTPMTSLRGYAQMTLRLLERNSTLTPERVRSTLNAVHQQTVRLSRLVEHVFEVSRLSSGRLALDRQETEVVALVRSMVHTTQVRTDQHTLVLSAPDPPLLAWVDPLRLEQVLLNLLDNAIKYSPDGGPIEVDVERRDAQLQIAVRDHGLGIPVEQRDHIFDRFYQAHADQHRSGMGLGLFLSKQIVDLHGGTTTATFPDDGGSRFVVTLPL